MSAYLDLRDLATEYVNLKERDEDKEDKLEDEEKERLGVLKALNEQLFTDMTDYAENESTMIPDEEFEEYAQDFAYDVGFATRDDINPLSSFIDWEGWADFLKGDYTEVTFDGDTYLIRSY